MGDQAGDPGGCRQGGGQGRKVEGGRQAGKEGRQE